MELFSRVVEDIYSAAPDPSRWPATLQAIADYFGDVGANLIYKRDDGNVVTIVSPSLQAAHDDYDAGWWQQDIRWARASEYLYRGHSGAFTDRHIVSDEEMRTHPFFTVFQPRHGLRWVVSMDISPDARSIVGLSVHRSPKKSAYSDDELSVFTRVGRHVEQSLRLSIRLIQAELTTLGLGDALSRLSTAVFVLDDIGRVIFSNTAAEGALNNGLSLHNHRLSTSAYPERDALEAAIDVALGDDAEDIADKLKPILIHRESSVRPLALYVLPIRFGVKPAIDRVLNRARAIVLAVDPEGAEPPDPALVRDLLGLTLSEARVASLIGSGLAPRDAALKLGISEETARTALKRVFTKVGVTRQSELTALLTRLVLR